MNKPQQYQKAGVSTITVWWLKTISSLRWCNPDYILSQWKKIGVDTFQLVPLRGMDFETIKHSWLLEKIETIEAPWWWTVGRILCWNFNHAVHTGIEVLHHNNSIISIDFIEGSAIEIADCWVELLNPKTLAILKLERVIEQWKTMVVDNFHARDYALWRQWAMKWLIPSKKSIENVYQNILDKNPQIVAVHIQERNPEQIKQFLSSWNSHLEFEINLLKQAIWKSYQDIPVIIELDPVPLSPLSLWISSWIIDSLKTNTNTLTKFVDKVNELRYW